MNPEDPSSGFRHDKVLTFINEQMSKQPEGSAFYQENLSLSWEEVEEKLRLLLEDNKMPSQAQEACAWGGLALGVRFAWRQGHLQRRRVQWLHDFASLHRSAAHALASDLKKLTDQQDMERKEAAFQLQLAHTRLAEVQRERDLMRLKLLHAELRAFPVGEMSGATRAPATAGGAKAETQNAGETEEVTASDKAVGEPEKEVAMAAPGELEGTGELGGSIVGHLGVMDWKDYGLGLEEEGEEREDDGKSIETLTCSDSGPLDLGSTPSPQSVTVQLPASFTYSYESPFPVTPTPSPPPSILTEPQMPPYFMATDMNMSNTEGPTVYLQEPPKQQRPGNWNCPWCKNVNFSQCENCFHCGGRIWLQSPQ